MNTVYQFFNVNNIFFTLLNYPISYLEFVGTIFNLACVILLARRNILSWPVGIIGVVLFGVLFYQIQLYADVFEQVYYLITGFAGWYAWAVRNKKSDDGKPVVSRNSLRTNLIWVGVIAVASAVLTYILSNIHTWMPAFFPEPASLPGIDATTTVMSFVAQYLLIKRRIDNWYLWIVVDIVAVWLYWYKGVPFVALLYLVFLVNAVYGLCAWKKHEHVATKAVA